MIHFSQKEAVIVVDDDDFIRDSYGDVLRNLGYTVLVAEDGEDALRVMTDYGAPIHLVISDISMPRMDGLEFVGMLRAAYPNMAALLVSGQGAQYLVDNRDRIPERVHFLAKPVTMGELASRVQEILAAR
jgi:two-component system cell cycle sensor histidine kinase/response regulator CckA